MKAVYDQFISSSSGIGLMVRLAITDHSDVPMGVIENKGFFLLFCIATYNAFAFSVISDKPWDLVQMDKPLPRWMSKANYGTNDSTC